MPILVPQLDGSPNAGDNCGPASIASALRWATKHDVEPSPSAVRRQMDDPVGGTLMSDHRKAWGHYMTVAPSKGWTLTPMKYHADARWSEFAAAFDGQHGATIAIDYSRVPRKYKGDPLFNGFHSVFVAAKRTRAESVEYKVFDPLCDGRRPGIPQGPLWYPAAVLKQAAGGVAGDGKAMYNIVRRGEPVHEPEPDPCMDDLEKANARIDELTEALGQCRTILEGFAEQTAAVLADLDALLPTEDCSNGEAPRDGIAR